VASGDSGSSDGVPGGAVHVDFPASSPYALACGGTRLKATATTILGEVVWHDAFGATGGGVSAFFALPVWQQGRDATTVQGAVQPLTARGVPDVAADADPQTGYEVVVDGVQTVFGGTSAVAPLWAGLIARINALTGRRAGYVQPVLYPRESAFRDITRGNNGAYRASAGWDACTGLGSPVGARIAAIPGV
jgi:kumamolisin